MEKQVIISASSDVPSDIKEFRGFYDYWLELSGDAGVPAVGKLDQSRLEGQKSNMAALEYRSSDRDFYFRAAGALINKLANRDVVGCRCVDVYGGPNWQGFRSVLMDVNRSGIPAHVTQGYRSQAGHDYLMESLAVPFLNEAGEGNLLYSLTYAHNKEYQWPSYDDGGFIRHHQLVKDLG